MESTASSSSTSSLTSSFTPLDDPISNSLDTSTMDSPESHAFLKMEDLHTSPAPSPSFEHRDSISSTQQTTPPPPVIVHSKPAKKRKSWGQELPEPKTTLPPRKRAKTDDEKEQRRIERIKRNRAAAHNSRERKRQETETLAVALARANAELDAYRRLHGPLPASVVLPEVTLSTTDDVSTPVPSLIDSRSSVEMTSPVSPLHDSLFDARPEVSIKQEPLADPPLFPSTMSPIEAHLDAKPMMTSSSALLAPLDPTQHSAAMLCDLQCRSSGSRGSNDAALITSNNNSIKLKRQQAAWWTHLFLSLMTLQLRTSYQTLLLALWTTFPSIASRMATRIALQQQRRSTPRRSRSSNSRPTTTTRATTSPSTTSSTTQRPQSPSRSSLALAQPSSAATARLSTRGPRGAHALRDGFVAASRMNLPFERDNRACDSSSSSESSTGRVESTSSLLAVDSGLVVVGRHFSEAHGTDLGGRRDDDDGVVEKLAGSDGV